MKPEELKEKTFNILPSTINLLIRNNALLESLADLLIKIEAKDNEAYKKELGEYFENRLKENTELATYLLVEVAGEE